MLYRRTSTLVASYGQTDDLEKVSLFNFQSASFVFVWVPPSSHNTSIAPLSEKVNKNYAQNKKLFLCNFTSFVESMFRVINVLLTKTFVKKLWEKFSKKGLTNFRFCGILKGEVFGWTGVARLYSAVNILASKVLNLGIFWCPKHLDFQYFCRQSNPQNL